MSVYWMHALKNAVSNQNSCGTVNWFNYFGKLAVPIQYIYSLLSRNSTPYENVVLAYGRKLETGGKDKEENKYKLSSWCGDNINLFKANFTCLQQTYFIQ